MPSQCFSFCRPSVPTTKDQNPHFCQNSSRADRLHHKIKQPEDKCSLVLGSLGFKRETNFEFSYLSWECREGSQEQRLNQKQSQRSHHLTGYSCT